MVLSKWKSGFQFSFKTMQDEASEEYRLIKGFYKANIEPIYGSQDSALSKLLHRNDRVCELLLTTSSLYAGAIAYKTQLVQEFDLPDAFELKSLFLLNENRKMGGLFFSLLLLRVAQKALEKKASSIVCTVSSEKENVLHLLRKFGFLIQDTTEGRYKAGIREHSLVHSAITKLAQNLQGYAENIMRRLN